MEKHQSVIMKKFLSVAIICLCVSNCGVTSLNYKCIPANQQQTGMGVANCSAQLLTHVPPFLDGNIRVLDLSNNVITQLGDDSFVKYEYLEELYLHNNSLSQLGDEVFSRLRNVLKLDMSFNNIEEIPSKAFRDLKALLTLALKGNRITRISASAFSYIGRLKNLYLSGNHIHQIHLEAFKGLNNLQHLELQNNALSLLDENVFKYFQTSLKEIVLDNNPWYCDCNLRWVIHWLKNHSETDIQQLKWKFNGNEPTCHGPSIIVQRPFSTLTGEWFICPISLYSKLRNIEATEGSEVDLLCKYMADPFYEIQWLINGQPINKERTDKYRIENEGSLMITSKLQVLNFHYDDIGKYECFAENKLGPASDSCLVTLEGVDPVVVLQPSQDEGDVDDGDNVRNAIIASCTIVGLVLVLVIIIIIVCCARRCKRYQSRKKESIRMSFEEHLKANGIIEPNPKHEPVVYDEVPDGVSTDADLDEPESVYNTLQRSRIPSETNTNTYISFKSELSEPEDMTQMYSQGQQTSTGSNSKASDGSQCESTSPLLENVSPILIDPHDPFYEANLYVPRLYASTNNYLSSTHNDYDDDKGFLVHRRIDSDFIPYRDEHGFILPSRCNGYATQRACTLPHNGHAFREPPLPQDDVYIPQRTRTLPHGYSPRHTFQDYGSTPVVRSNGVSANHKSASVGHLGMNPPKKPPRSFNSRDTVSLYSQNSVGEKDGGLKLSLPKPGTVDKYGTAV